MAEETMKEMRAEIDRLLHQMRPDRYVKSERVLGPRSDEADEAEGADATRGDDWLVEVAEAVEHLLPDSTARRLYAISEVRNREGGKTQKANNTIRKIGKTGQYLAGWFDLKRDPVAVVTREPLWSGGERVREERVALEGLTKEDMVAFEMEERRQSAKEFKVRNETCDTLQMLVRELDQAGLNKLGEWMRDADEAEGTGTDDV